MSVNFIFRQAQTAVVSREIAANWPNAGWGPLPVFGEGTQVPFEFPLFQIITALLNFLGLPLEIAGRGLSLFLFQLSSLVAYLILQKFNSKKAPLIFLIMSQLSPFGVIWSAAFLIEFLATAASLLMVYSFLNWKGGMRKISLLPLSAAFGAVGGLVKITTLLPFLVLLGAIAILRHQKENSTRGIFFSAAGASGIALLAGATSLLWTRVADEIKSANPSTEWLTSTNLRNWNFGTFEQRLDNSNQAFILSTLEQVLFSPALVITTLSLALYNVIMGQHRLFILGLFGSALAGPLVFWNLYAVHTYYMSAVYFQLIMLAAFVFSTTFDTLLGHQPRKRQVALIASLLIPLIVTSLLNPKTSWELNDAYSHRPISQEAAEVLKYVLPNETFLTVGCDWSPQLVYETGRTAIMSRSEFSSDNQLPELRELAGRLSEQIQIVLVDCRGFTDNNWAWAFEQGILRTLGEKTSILHIP
jgi:hypothetical protein